MVSFVITSCLDDDNNIEYSPDATIHAFELDTTGLGKYKFTIDQYRSKDLLFAVIVDKRVSVQLVYIPSIHFLYHIQKQKTPATS